MQIINPESYARRTCGASLHPWLTHPTVWAILMHDRCNWTWHVAQTMLRCSTEVRDQRLTWFVPQMYQYWFLSEWAVIEIDRTGLGTTGETWVPANCQRNNKAKKQLCPSLKPPTAAPWTVAPRVVDGGLQPQQTIPWLRHNRIPEPLGIHQVNTMNSVNSVCKIGGQDISSLRFSTFDFALSPAFTLTQRLLATRERRVWKISVVRP